jgi:transposase InsO family protein
MQIFAPFGSISDAIQHKAFEAQKARSGSPRHEGWLYLATVIDLYPRQVVGWAMSERMTAQLACDALQMALWCRHMPTGDIVHTDRGSQYCSGAYQALIKQHGLLYSMSAKCNCYDNACAESFFHSLKVKAIHGQRFSTRQECARQYSNILKWITIKLADTAPMAISAQKRLRQKKSLNAVSTVGGQDQIAYNSGNQQNLHS